MCNDTGVSHDPTLTPYLKVKSEYASASAMSRKKTAKPELKRQYEKISNLNATIKSLASKKTDIMGETGVYRELRKQYSAVNCKLWRAKRQLWREKKTLIHMCPRPINVIIPRRITVGGFVPHYTPITSTTTTTTTSFPPPDDEGEENSTEGDEEESQLTV